MIDKIKLILGIETADNDPVLELMVEDAKRAVVIYCNRHSFPEALEHVARELVVNAFKAENGDNVSSIKRGDTQITYTNTITSDSFTPRMVQQMNRYRILRLG